MAGLKLAAVRQAATKLYADLLPHRQGRAWSPSTTRCAPSRHPPAARRTTRSAAAIAAIEPAGSTNLLAGWLEAGATWRRRCAWARPIACCCSTDGQANVGITDAARPTELGPDARRRRGSPPPPSASAWTRVFQTVRAIGDAPLFIDDSPNPTLLEVASKSRRLKAEKGLALVILDYLQLMQAGGKYENRNLEIAAISRGLKQLAKELEVPVIALSQLSRAAGAAGERPPAAALRPPRVGVDRAGRRHGGLRLPRRGLRRRPTRTRGSPS